MPYDSAATKKRLLDAALDEFAERGLAGARVDRIAEKASANKQAIYAYFGSKEDLFRCVLEARCKSVFDAVPCDPSDLPAFVAGVFDHLVENPKSVRMMMWRQLELPDEAAHDAAAAKVHALGAAHELGVTSKQCAEDMFVLLLGLPMAWFMFASSQPAARGAAAQQRLHAFRRSMIAAAEAIVKTMAEKKR